ncbi:IS3 family transposase [Pseudomonas sp. YH-1]|uniref:IS3 family transposase n=1 Tax=Pseudomonas sp. YH-1 TaxID=3384787 RepID=UPI003F80E940
MTTSKDKSIEVLGQERRRRRGVEEKLAMVRESLEPGQSVSVVAQRNGSNPNQLFHWRKLYQDGSLSAVSAGDTSNTRWCSDGFEFRCEDGEKLRVTFALDCCDREAISWVASPHGYSGDDVRDVMLEAIEQRFGSELPASPVQWLSDNGSAYTAEQTRTFARQIGLLPLTTPVCSPQSNGMAESFVKTMKRDYIRHMPKPDRATALRNLAIAFEHYNEEHPHSALNYRSPREFRRLAEAST